MTVYQGAQIRLTVTRTLRWVKLFAVSNSDDYVSDPFTVPEHWRIRYRLTGNDYGFAFVSSAGRASTSSAVTASSRTAPVPSAHTSATTAPAAIG